MSTQISINKLKFDKLVDLLNERITNSDAEKLRAEIEADYNKLVRESNDDVIRYLGSQVDQNITKSKQEIISALKQDVRYHLEKDTDAIRRELSNLKIRLDNLRCVVDVDLTRYVSSFAFDQYRNELAQVIDGIKDCLNEMFTAGEARELVTGIVDSSLKCLELDTFNKAQIIEMLSDKLSLQHFETLKLALYALDNRIEKIEGVNNTEVAQQIEDVRNAVTGFLPYAAKVDQHSDQIAGIEGDVKKLTKSVGAIKDISEIEERVATLSKAASDVLPYAAKVDLHSDQIDELQIEAAEQRKAITDMLPYAASVMQLQDQVKSLTEELAELKAYVKKVHSVPMVDLENTAVTRIPAVDMTVDGLKPTRVPAIDMATDGLKPTRVPMEELRIPTTRFPAVDMTTDGLKPTRVPAVDMTVDGLKPVRIPAVDMTTEGLKPSKIEATEIASGPKPTRIPAIDMTTEGLKPTRIPAIDMTTDGLKPVRIPSIDMTTDGLKPVRIPATELGEAHVDAEAPAEVETPAAETEDNQ